jgi:uncharacterized protein (DUF1919 family)
MAFTMRRVKCAIARTMVGSYDFTIVSNNCWGAHVYQQLNIEFRTPFVGLFLQPACYLRLLANFDDLITRPLTATPESIYPRVNQMRKTRELNYPIARLGDEIEINFMHYSSMQEAEDKWHCRLSRMVKDPKRYFYKFDDIGADVADIQRFLSLPYANKICFVSKPMNLPNVVQAPADPDGAQVVDGWRLGRVSKRYFNTLRWISTRPSYMPLPSWL